MIDRILHQIPPNSKLLDLGCGISDRGRKLSAYHDVTSIDISPRIVQQQTAAANAANLKTFRAIEGDIQRLPFQNQSFDVVLAIEILEHLESPYETMIEAHRVLKQNGILVISLPTTGSEDLFRALHRKYRLLSGHQQRIRPEEVRAWLSQLSFNLISQDKANGHWTIFWLMHSALQSKFDETGQVHSNFWINRIWDFALKMLHRLGWMPFVSRCLDRMVPKSWIFVSQKRGTSLDFLA